MFSCGVVGGYSFAISGLGESPHIVIRGEETLLD